LIEACLYYSSCKVPAIVGIASVVSNAVPDCSALNPEHKYFDPKSDPENPRWFGLEIKFDRKLRRPITLQELKKYR
jgi:predicted RNA-binding protein with PUA-like domain